MTGLARAAYLVSDSSDPGGPGYEFIDIRYSGEQVVEDNLANGGSPLQLKVPIVFYDEVVYRVVVSVNGYISTFGSDPGLDETPNMLPRNPVSGGGARIYPYHADLDLGNSSAGFPRGVFYQYFHRSPHPHSTGGVHVFQWERVNHHAGALGLHTFQALIFDNGDVLFQYENTPPAVGARDYTVGVQRSDPNGFFRGVTYAKFHDRSTDPDVYGGLAVLFEPPTITVTTVARSSPIGSINLYDAIEFVGAQEVVHKIEFAPFLAGLATELTTNLEFQCLDQPDPACVRCPALIIDASNLADGHRIVAEGLSGAGHVPGRFMLGADYIGNSTSPFHRSRFTPPYIHFNNIECVGENAAILVQDDFGALVMTDCLFKDSDNGVVVFEDFTGERTTRIAGQVVMRGCEVVNCKGYNQSIGISDLLFSFQEMMPFGALTGTGLSLHDCVFRDSDGVVFGNPYAAGGVGIGRPEIEIYRCSIEGGTGKFASIERPRSLIIEDSSFESDGLALISGGREQMEVTIDRSFFGGIAYEALISSLATVRNSTFSGGGRYISQRGVGNTNPADLYMQNCTVVRDGAASLSAIAFTSDGFENFRFRAENCIFTGGAFKTDHFSVGRNVTLTAIAERACLSDRIDSVVSTTPALTPEDPLLLPLAMNGGLTPSHLPGAGSLALDGGSEISLAQALAATDQRGDLRKRDFDGNGTAQVDIGAVEVEPVTEVTTLVDEAVNPGTGVSLREALGSASPGTRITFAPGLSGGTMTLGSTLNVTADVKIDASGLAGPVLIRSTSQSFVLLRAVSGLELEVSSLHFAGGQRAIQVANDNVVTLNDLRIENADAGNDSGGGVFVGDSCVLHARRVEISGCEAWQGAGIYVGASDLTLEDCWIHDCVATREGGAVFVRENFTAGPDLSRCALIRNRATDGAGFYKGNMPSTAAGVAFVRGCTIGENVGGAISNAGGPLFVQFTTIHRNSVRGGVTGSLAGTNYYHVIATANTSDDQLLNFSGGVSGDYNLEDGNSSVLTMAGDLRLLDAKLTPLGWHGGFTPTYAPLAGSPAINAGDTLHTYRSEFNEETADYSGSLRDGRGFTRPRFSTPHIELDTGLLVNGLVPDIGAVEVFEPIVVGTQIDQNQTPAGSLNSLREALRDCPDGGRITFAAGLSGTVANLSNGQLTVTGKSVMVDATGLARGFRLRGSGERCLEVGSTSAISMHAVSVSKGSSSAPAGGIWSRGKLLVTRAAIHDNVASGNGGGILHSGSFLHVANCTLSGNQAQGGGGGINHSGTGEFRMEHCTVYGNSALGGGSGIRLGDSYLHMEHSAFERNGTSSGSVLELAGLGKLRSGGYNLEDGSDFASGAIRTDRSSVEAGLDDLADNGGHALSHWPAANSPLRDGGALGTPRFAGSDQLGGARVLGKFVDIGALEMGGYYEWVQGETSDPKLQDFDADADGDGLRNGLDYLLTGQPQAVMNTTGLGLTFTWRPQIPDVDFAVEASSDLTHWTSVYEVRRGKTVSDSWLETVSSSGATRTATVRAPVGEEGFIRLKARLR